ncbi:zinc finger protein ZAT4-like [Neltuma alba]|uniref:zinc finger protein ZAT4-like n=1 Tax=Neltuma alba TaxID=207710 RepID=UPI0010A4471A|nr:zinc finger protein ZAT4-like [Prosopis alba]XP_028763347.1 zinc finger protein ZAT4-like [Prosopis alba]
MAFMVGDRQSNFKHFCKICKKGFGCGRALGGHMRAHGIGDEGGGMDDDDDPASDWEDSNKLGGDSNVSPSNKRMYALRTNPNRFKSVRICENCRKEFFCWKSFLEHGKCTSDDPDESFVSSPGSDGDDMSGRRGCGWSKRKRSFRAKVGSFNNNPNYSPSNEDEDLANCLMMLSNAAVDPLDESSAFASKDEDRRNPNLSFMAPMSQISSDHNKAKEGGGNNINHKGLFECKACKKVFNSHQALGGHRASHKKVKGCFAARLDNLDDSGTGADDDVITHEDQLFPTNKSNNNSALHFDQGSNNNNASSMASSSKRKSKVHECSICHRVFSSGQALGGHKRCHWITSNAPDTSALARFQQFQEQIEQHMTNNNQVMAKFDDSDQPIDLKLDLNLPAPSRNVSTEIYLQSWVGGGSGGVVKEHKDDKSQSLHRRQEMDNENNNDEECKNSNKNLNASSGSTMPNVEDDEAESKVKLAKLSELKDMNVGGSSSPWLQVGIGSSTTTTDVGTDP